MRPMPQTGTRSREGESETHPTMTSTRQILPTKLTPIQWEMLKTAQASPDGTVLAIGFNRHGPAMKSFPTATAKALVARKLLYFVKTCSWGSVYKITGGGMFEVDSCHTNVAPPQ